MTVSADEVAGHRKASTLFVCSKMRYTKRIKALNY